MSADTVSVALQRSNRPADWKQQMKRWDRYHYVRVGVIVAAFALLAAALT